MHGISFSIGNNLKGNIDDPRALIEFYRRLSVSAPIRKIRPRKFTPAEIMYAQAGCNNLCSLGPYFGLGRHVITEADLRQADILTRACSI